MPRFRRRRFRRRRRRFGRRPRRRMMYSRRRRTHGLRRLRFRRRGRRFGKVRRLGGRAEKRIYAFESRHPALLPQAGRTVVNPVLGAGSSIVDKAFTYSYMMTSMQFGFTEATGTPAALPTYNTVQDMVLPGEPPYGLIYPLRMPLWPGFSGTPGVQDFDMYNYFKPVRITYVFTRQASFLTTVVPYMISFTSPNTQPIFTTEFFNKLPNVRRRLLRPGRSVKISWRPQINGPPKDIQTIQYAQIVDNITPVANQWHPQPIQNMHLRLDGKRIRCPWLSTDAFNKFYYVAPAESGAIGNDGYYGNNRARLQMLNMAFSGPTVLIQSPVFDATATPQVPASAPSVPTGAINNGTDIVVRMYYTVYYKGRTRKIQQIQPVNLFAHPGIYPIQARTMDISTTAATLVTNNIGAGNTYYSADAAGVPTAAHRALLIPSNIARNPDDSYTAIYTRAPDPYTVPQGSTANIGDYYNASN